MVTRIFSDLDLDFTKHPVTKDVSKKINDNAIIASLRNLIMTNYYERPFNPKMGSNISALLFEPIDTITASIMRNEIKTMISNYEPRVRINDLQVNADPDSDKYDVTLVFYTNNSIKPITVNLFLNRLR